MNKLSTTLTVLLLILALGAIAEQISDEIYVYSDLDSAISAGKPVMAIVHNSKVCPCTLKKCNQALELTRKIAQDNNGEFVYIEINLGDEPDLNDRLKTTIVPTVIFFDSEGEEISRLQSMQIRDQKLREQLAAITGPKTENNSKETK